MKVKKFRIKPRLGIVSRNLRSMMAVKQLPEELENILPQENQLFLSQMSPLAFYRTWTGNKIPDGLKAMLEKSGLSKPVAISILVATIGLGPEETLSKLLLNGETAKSQVWTALSEDAADLSLNFIFKLLCDDAQKDDCEVPEMVMVTDEPMLAETLELVGAAQENVRIENAHLSPRFTRIALAAWIPVSKKKTAVLAAKKPN